MRVTVWPVVILLLLCLIAAVMTALRGGDPLPWVVGVGMFALLLVLVVLRRD